MTKSFLMNKNDVQYLIVKLEKGDMFFAMDNKLSGRKQVLLLIHITFSSFPD